MTQKTPRTPLTEMLAGIQPTGNGLGVSVPADWLQGRAIYGGLSAALCLTAAQKTFDGLPPLRSAVVSFIGPAGGDVELAATKLRQGKSTAFINVDLMGDGKLAVRANFCFGARRPSQFAKRWLPAPEVPAVDDCGPFFPEGAAPNFAGHFNSRRASGHSPVSGADKGDLCAWIQHKDADAHESTEGLVALADAMPPAAMSLFTEPAPISTMTWMFDVVTHPVATRGGWWLSRSVADTAYEGYSAQKMAVWNTDGQPVIIGQQNVAVFI